MSDVDDKPTVDSDNGTDDTVEAEEEGGGGRLMDELESDNNVDSDHEQYTQSSDDENNGGRKRRQRRTKTESSEAVTSPVVEDKRAEARKDFEAALAKIKQGKQSRRRPQADSADVTLDDDAIALVTRMQRAVHDDNESVLKGKPALRKLELLPTVLSTMNQQHMLEFLLDNRLLEAIRMWMEPLPNGTLPSVDLRLSLLQALVDISPSIDTQLLRESRVGRIVMFFSRRSGEYPPIQRLADQLVTTWSRPIVGHSSDYRTASGSSVMMQSEELRKRGDRSDGKTTPTISKLLAKSSQRRRK